MNYIIKEKYGPGSEEWKEYAKWSGLEHCEEYYSVDGIMRRTLFEPKSEEDWRNCVNENFRTHLITNIEYAKKIINNYHEAEVIGVIEDPKSYDRIIPSAHELVGYDVVDDAGDISLVTNWGSEEERPDMEKNRFSLIGNIEQAYDYRDRLRSDFSDDAHATWCEVWAVYRIDIL